MSKFSNHYRIKVITSYVLTLVLISIACFGIYFFIERKIYPVKYENEILLYSNEYDIDFYEVLSLIKVESGFDQFAVSDKGAKGLMQIIDTTAEYIAKELDYKEYDIFDEETNIRFGCFYLGYLFSKFENTKTVLSAYNAGEGNVRNWLNEKSLSKDGRNLDFIPFKETREYINRFEKTLVKYKKLYKNLLDKQ